tara:strand:+ start:164 stop:922 length:759 start_codon:yes stop_codon:yes gene_type:complete
MDINVNHIKENGYTIIPNFLNDKEITELQNLCDTTPVYMGETWDKIWKANGKFDEYEHWWSRVRDHPLIMSIKQKIRPLADKCFGKDKYEQCYGGDFKVTNPGSNFMYCHFDTPYRHKRWANDFSEDILGMQFGIALDNFDDISGGTRILPGSHKKIYLREDMDSMKHDEEFLRDGITMELEPGGLFCYHSRIMHSPMPNKTQKPRRLLLLLHLSNTPSFIQELSKVEDEETYTIENGSAFKKLNRGEKQDF